LSLTDAVQWDKNQTIQAVTRWAFMGDALSSSLGRGTSFCTDKFRCYSQ